MASFVGAVRNMTGDQWWFLKIGLFSAALFYILYIEYDYPPNDQSILTYKIALAIIFLGIAAVSMNRNINNKEPFFPGLLAIPEVIMRTVFSTVLVLPGVVAGYFLFNYLGTFELEIGVKITLYVLAIALISPFVLIPVVLYSVRSNFLDALKFNLILEGSGNIIVQALSFMLQAALIGGAVTITIYYLLLQMLGDHVALLIWKSIVIVLLYFSIFSFASDLYGEAIPEIKTSDKVKKKLSREEAIAQRKERSMKKNRAGGENKDIGDNPRQARQNRLNRVNRPNRPHRPNRPE